MSDRPGRTLTPGEALAAVEVILGCHPYTCLSIPQGRADCECIVCRIRQVIEVSAPASRSSDAD